MIKSRSFIATPPGATIKEQITDRGMTQKEFASRMDLSEKHISHLINGDVQLTPETALRLEMVLGVPSEFWNGLETIYRDKIIKARAENEMDEDEAILKKLPYKAMSENGWVASTNSTKEKVVEARKFFEVARLGLLERGLFPGIACRVQATTENIDFLLFAWAQKAKIEARKIKTKPIDITSLSNNISSIRSMTSLNPKDFCPTMISILANSGIALVFLPHIGGSFLHGATFCDGNKIVIGLTVRGKDADKFWFSLFHEIGHIIYGHINQSGGTTTEDEAKADKYAQTTLIPQTEYEMFIQNNNFSRASIIEFAKSIGIDTGIVVGRLQKDGLLSFAWLNDLKTKYMIS